MSENARSTVLVSGATGFMGTAVTRELLSRGHRVRAMSRSADHARIELGEYPEGRTALDEGRLTFVEADVTQPQTLDEAVREVDAVAQTAQFPGAPVEDPDKGLTYMNVDRNGTINLLQAIARVYEARTAGPGITRFTQRAPHFLYLSGVTVREGAANMWDRAKWQAEEAIKGSGLDWSIVRASPAYGPEDKSFNRLIGYSDYQPFVAIFGDGNEKLTPGYVGDVGRIFARLLEERDRVRDLTLPFGGPQVVTMNDLLRTMLEVMGRRRRLLHIPKPVGKAQAFVLQFLPGRFLTPDAVEFSAQGGVADLTRLRETFPDFELTPLREGLASYLG